MKIQNSKQPPQYKNEKHFLATFLLCMVCFDSRISTKLIFVWNSFSPEEVSSFFLDSHFGFVTIRFSTEVYLHYDFAYYWAL